MKKVVPLLLLIGILLCALIGKLGYKAYLKYAPTKELADQEAFYGVSGNELVLFLDDEQQEETGLFMSNQVYLPVAWVDAHLNKRFYWDGNEQLLVYTLPDEVLYMDGDTRGDSGAPVVAVSGQEAYVSAETITRYTDVRIVPFVKDEVKRVFVDTGWEADEWRSLTKDTPVREKGGVKGRIVVQEPEGSRVKVLKTSEGWSKVRTEDGHVGYVSSRRLGGTESMTYISTFQEPVYASMSMDQKVCLVWHQVTSPEGNATIQKLLQNTRGVNVVSPTWFAMTDNEGNYTSLADKAYVDALHSLGIQVWALIDNFSSDVQTEVMLSKTSVRKRLIDSLMQEVDTYGLDGLNLDFESLKESAGPHYIQFIRELSVACRAKQVVLSVDDHVPAPYNVFYDRREQGIVADYVIIMGYDEHYSGGEAGPVASYPYVKAGIEGTLEEVPKEKVINAIPFYTRVWKEDIDGNTSSDALGIADAMSWVRTNFGKKEKLSWQEENGLYYGQIVDKKEGKKEIWLEEERSLGMKMDLIREYDLAGVACWKLGFEPADIWDIVKVNE